MKIALRYIAFIAIIVTSFIACDKDFASLDSDIINSGNASNFDTDRAVYNSIVAYSKKLGPVQTNTTPFNQLGYGMDPVYGNTTYTTVMQVSSSLVDPDFGENVELDSVVLTIPYFSTLTGEIDEEGNSLFELDSVYNASSPMRIRLFENTFFLRDFDPNSEFDDPQAYYSNQSTSLSDFISQSALEGPEIEQAIDNTNSTNLNNFLPRSSIVQLKDAEGNVTQSLAPSFRVKLDNDFWQQKIFDMEGQPELSNANNFANYFRGIYFKVEPIFGNAGSLMFLNFASSNANITMYYTRDPFTEGLERDAVTYTLSFSGNRVNFLENSFNFPLIDGDEDNGDVNIFLKGGEGSIGEIKLFDGTDIDEDNTTINTFEAFKNEFVNTSEEGKFLSRKRLINEANLIVKVDESFSISEDEDTRLFLYDADNNTPLIDYFIDAESSNFPFESRTNHLGQLQTIENEQGEEEKVYKFNITQHVINLLTEDSTNVKLGISVSNNVNLEQTFAQPKVQVTPSSTISRAPLSSIISHRGTVLFGSNHPNENKRVYLEIFYTEPEN